MDAEIFKAALRMVISLPLVAALAYFAIKYGLGRRATVSFGQRRMRLLEQAPLGHKASLSLVQAGNKYYLLAHQDGTVTVVKEMDALPEVIAESTTAVPEFQNLTNLISAGIGRIRSMRTEGERRDR